MIFGDGSGPGSRPSFWPKRQAKTLFFEVFDVFWRVSEHMEKFIRSIDFLLIDATELRKHRVPCGSIIEIGPERPVRWG